MECASVHSVIERSVRSQPSIYVRQHYVHAMSVATKGDLSISGEICGLHIPQGQVLRYFQ